MPEVAPGLGLGGGCGCGQLVWRPANRPSLGWITVEGNLWTQCCSVPELFVHSSDYWHHRHTPLIYVATKVPVVALFYQEMFSLWMNLHGNASSFVCKCSTMVGISGNLLDRFRSLIDMQRGGSDLLMDSHLNFVEVHLCFSPTKLFFFWKKKKKRKGSNRKL